jgi:hypothetical protein
MNYKYWIIIEDPTVTTRRTEIKTLFLYFKLFLSRTEIKTLFLYFNLFPSVKLE